MNLWCPLMAIPRLVGVMSRSTSRKASQYYAQFCISLHYPTKTHTHTHTREALTPYTRFPEASAVTSSPARHSFILLTQFVLSLNAIHASGVILAGIYTISIPALLYPEQPLEGGFRFQGLTKKNRRLVCFLNTLVRVTRKEVYGRSIYTPNQHKCSTIPN